MSEGESRDGGSGVPAVTGGPARGVRGTRAILHADLDAFYASVEQRDDPALRGRPVLVGGGVVLAASYEARARGVRGGMGGGRARALCPDAVVVEPRWSAYVEASRAVRAILEDAAPEVEPVSIDEAYLDVTGLDRLGRAPRDIARRLRRDVRREVGLPLTVGAATTRLLAKIACGAAKPDGVLALRPEEELAFLHGRPVTAVPGVGPATAKRLHAHGLETVGDVAAWPRGVLVAWFGEHGGARLHAVARNVDPTPVRAGRRRRSFGAQAALGREARPWPSVEATLAGLVDRVTRRMREAGRAGRTVTLRLRFSDYERATRSRTLPIRTAGTAEVLAVARELLAAARPLVEARGLTLVGVAVSGLEDDAAPLQLVLPLGEDAPQGGDRGRALDAAVDAVRERFGAAAVGRASAPQSS